MFVIIYIKTKLYYYIHPSTNKYVKFNYKKCLFCVYVILEGLIKVFWKFSGNNIKYILKLVILLTIFIKI